ncbi:MAG: translation initiation factor IF-2 N-terminal domain-containing protein [Clostridiales bacterium]|nr:translation initiation factor IF-2 N-terminal domain-containing protein [Clostridiales bacterium]
MSKIRVYKLAKEINMSNKSLVEKLKDMGIVVKNHMSSISEEDYKKIMSELNKKVTISTKAVSDKVVTKKVEVKSEEKTEEKTVEKEEGLVEEINNEEGLKTNKKRHKQI